MTRQSDPEYDPPSRGDGQWAGPLNETFRAIETDVRALAERLDALEDSTGESDPLTDRLWSLLSSSAGARTVEPTVGAVSVAVDGMAEEGDATSGDTWQVRRDAIRLQAGETYRVDNPVRVGEGNHVHAVDATVVPQNDDAPVFVLQRESVLWGGQIELGSSGATGVTMTGKGFGRPMGPRGTTITADGGNGSTGLVIDSGDSHMGFHMPFVTTVGVDEAFVQRATGDAQGLWQNGNNVAVRARDYRRAITLEGGGGDPTMRRNRYCYDLYPTQRSETAVLLDNPQLLYNTLEGRIRNEQYHDTTVHVKTVDEERQFPSGRNTFMSYGGSTDGEINWQDNYGDNGVPDDRMYPYEGPSFPSVSPATANRDVLVATGDVEYGGGGTDDPGFKGRDTRLGENLRSTLAEAAARDAPTDVRIEPGSLFTLEGDLRVPGDVAVDARGVSVEVEGTIRFEESGGLWLSGHLDKTTAGPMMVIEADGTTIDEPTGPVKPHVHGFANHRYGWTDEDSVDPQLRIRAVNGGEITGLQNSMLARDGENGLDVVADAASRIHDNRLHFQTLWAGYLMRVRGQGTIEDNQFSTWLQPKKDTSNDPPTVWYTDVGLEVDGPNVRNNVFQGQIWDQHKIDGPGVRVRRCGEGNALLNYMGDHTKGREDEYFTLAGDDLGEFDVASFTELDQYDEGLLERSKRDRLYPMAFSPLPLPPVE